jgi:hypothetical protein
MKKKKIDFYLGRFIRGYSIRGMVEILHERGMAQDENAHQTALAAVIDSE